MEVFVGDDGLITHKTCAHCLVIRAWLLKVCGGWTIGDTLDDLEEHVDESARDVRKALFRARRKWASNSGQLWPVPADLTVEAMA